MTRAEFNAFCRSLPQSTHVVQWGGSDVWKVGGKVFAIGVPSEAGLAVTFKTSEIAYRLLSQQPGCRPAPYLASRGMKWIQRTAATGLSDNDLKAYLRQSYLIVVAGLTKKTRAQLGLVDPLA